MRLRAFGAAILAGILTACGSSPPSHYYQLSAQPDPPAVRKIGGPVRTVALGEVKLPGALDRPQIARQIGPNQLEYAETDRWAGPLDEMTRRVLSADLRPLLPAGMALVASDSSAPADLTVAVEVSRFDFGQGGPGDPSSQLGNLGQERQGGGGSTRGECRRARFRFRYRGGRRSDEPGPRPPRRQHRRRHQWRRGRGDPLIRTGRRHSERMPSA